MFLEVVAVLILVAAAAIAVILNRRARLGTQAHGAGAIGQAELGLHSFGGGESGAEMPQEAGAGSAVESGGSGLDGGGAGGEGGGS